MKVEFKDGFKLLLIAETELERIFLSEWERRSEVDVTDNRNTDCRFIDPAFITWVTSP